MSIVIPSYNDIPYLTKCLDSIASTCERFDYEVIVVDDYCQPANSERLRALEGQRVRVVLKDRRVGFAGTVNRGMELAAHDIVLLNSDIVALPGWLEALQDSAYGIDPKIGLVSPKLIYPNGRIQYGGTYWARILAPQWFGHLWVGSPATRSTANVATYNRSISGACAYLTRSAYERLGGLDENYWLGFEDVDWGLRAWDLGIRCYYQPASMLIHHESASRGYSQGSRELASMRYFWGIWSDRFLSATVTSPPPIDFVVGSASSGLWSEHILAQSELLRELGHVVRIHHVIGPEPDEEVVQTLHGVSSVKVATDWTAGPTAWLSATSTGRAAYLLPGMESARFPDDPARQSWIVAHYRPEFDYIAPDRWAEERLRAEAAWESRGRVAPAPAHVDPQLDESPSAIVTLGATDLEKSWIEQIAADLSAPTVHLGAAEPTSDVREMIRRAGARVVVALDDYDTSFPLLTLQGLGVAVVAVKGERIRYEIMDGFNALLVRRDDREDLARAVVDIMTHADVWRSLRNNGVSTARRLSEQYPRRLSRLLNDIAQTTTT